MSIEDYKNEIENMINQIDDQNILKKLYSIIHKFFISN